MPPEIPTLTSLFTSLNRQLVNTRLVTPKFVATLDVNDSFGYIDALCNQVDAQSERFEPAVSHLRQAYDASQTFRQTSDGAQQLAEALESLAHNLAQFSYGVGQPHCGQGIPLWMANDERQQVRTHTQVGSPWEDPHELTYALVGSSRHGDDMARAAVEAAVEQWRQVIDEAGASHKLKLVRGGDDARIRIRFVDVGDHGCGPDDAFVDVSSEPKILAHAYYPFPVLYQDLPADRKELAGDICINDTISPDPQSANFYDLTAVIAHEIGHALGLGHDELQNSIMFRKLSAGTRSSTLQPSARERARIRKMYVEEEETEFSYMLDDAGGGSKPSKLEVIR